MFSISRRILVGVFVAGLAASACNKMPAPFEVKDRTPLADRDAAFDPANTYPGWAYDGPGYMRPAAPLTSVPRAKKGDPLHYFTRNRLVMIRQPSGYTPEEIPRVAVWWTDNNGFHWHKGGYFGRQQKFFPLEAEEDGDYGIRFVGPGQQPAAHAPAHPERVYHVDTMVPEVELQIEPEQSWYHVGQTIAISWRADDYHLVRDPVAVRLLMDLAADEPKAIELQRDLAREGSIAYEIPSETLDHEIRFRVDASDRSGNVGIAYSFALQIVEQTAADTTGAKETDREMNQATVGVAGVDTRRPPAEAMETDVTVASSPTPETRAPTMGVDLMYGESPEVPFASEAARDRTEDSRLTSTGGTVRSGGGLFGADLSMPADSPHEAVVGISDDAPTVQKASAPAEVGTVAPLPDDTARISRASQEDDDAAVAGEDYPCVEDELIVVDLTHGNGLLIPLPATVEGAAPMSRWATVHPWRMLGELLSSSLQTVWALPRPQFSHGLNRIFEGRFLADYPASRPVAEPGAVSRVLAGVPDGTVETDPESVP